MKKFTGLIHSRCGGMIAPALADDLTEADLREFMDGSRPICMRCGEEATDELEAEYVELIQEGG